jgi:hypothetical protein
MRAAWASFATIGAPTDPDTGVWPTSGCSPLGTDDGDDFDDVVGHRVGIWLGDE